RPSISASRIPPARGHAPPPAPRAGSPAAASAARMSAGPAAADPAAAPVGVPVGGVPVADAPVGDVPADGAEALVGGKTMNKPVAPATPALDPVTVAPRSGSGYPAPYRDAVAKREKRALGDALGLSHFGVNLVRL